MEKPTEQTPEELAPLEQLLAYVNQIKDEGFVWVYRGESIEHDDAVSGGGQENRHLRGTWFTTSFTKAEKFAETPENGTKTQITAILIPRDMLLPENQTDQYGPTDEVNILNPHLLKSKRVVTEPVLDSDDAETYINQFDFAKNDTRNQRHT